MSHFEISRQFVVVLICSVAKVRPNKQLTCTKTSPFLTNFQILWIMYYLYFSFCQVLFGVGTHGRWSDLFLIFFFALWTPIGDIRGHSPKIRILHFQVVFFGVSPCEIKLPWPGCFAIWDCEIFGLRLPIALSCHARIWNLIFVFFAGAWFNHFLTLIRSLMLDSTRLLICMPLANLDEHVSLW